jgi:hypothetical protein
VGCGKSRQNPQHYFLKMLIESTNKKSMQKTHNGFLLGNRLLPTGIVESVEVDD